MKTTHEIIKELGLESKVEGRKNYLIRISTLWGTACACSRGEGLKRELYTCAFADIVNGEIALLDFTYKKDAEEAMEKLSKILKTKWV